MPSTNSPETTTFRPETTMAAVDQTNDASGGASSQPDLEAAEEKGDTDDTSVNDGKINGRSKGQIAVIMLALCLAVLLAALDATIITTALPTISEHFNSSAGYVWIGSAYLLANASATPSWAKFSDIFGRKPMLLFANVIFFVGSLVAGLANSIGMLIAARAVQGIGAGGLSVLASIVVGDLIPLRIRGGFYGIIGAMWAVALSIGPIIGGALTENVSWRWCFYINLPVDGLAFFILVFFLDVKTPRTPILEGLKAIDWVGALLVVGATLMFLFGLEYGGQSAPWDSAKVICLIVFGVVTFAIFLIWDWKFAKFPIMPTQLFASTTNCATLGAIFFHGIVFIAGTYYLPLYFQTVRGASPIMSGVDLLPTAVSLGLSSVATGAFVGITGKFLPPIWFGFFFMTLGFGLYIDIDATSNWAKLILYQIVASVGIGPLFQAPIVALQAHIHPRDIGTGTATLSFVRALATSIGVVVGNVVYTNQFEKNLKGLSSSLSPQELSSLTSGEASDSTGLINSLPQPAKSEVQAAFAASLQPMWIMYCCFAAAGLIVSLFIKPKKLTSEHEETKTGLEAEHANAEARAAEKASKGLRKDQREGSMSGSQQQDDEKKDQDVESA
ncbi:hypothetical protein M409DRAFT_16622 [Zasmidium cellare ATCC 36951]|uniref:Efflux pump dotC n=1 Tax=Zasmidium cellare ATCC 36951 TaxID=1080233 RepID=A0A6A6D2S0_ZASCE|nr:uncharacterized protein M409DRAFT_16622 [Zasmidium cellare ATCC 36951]KAF2172660.1 hypothetical protein M409DRAFT_16622 [Zasmidium cellare ATCC 36951]